MVVICLAVLAGMGLERLGTRFRLTGRPWVGPLACIMILADLLLLSPTPFPLPLSYARVPDYYHTLAAQPEEFGIMQIPIHRRGSEMYPGQYFYYQTVHHKGIPYIPEGVYGIFLARVKANPLLAYLWYLEHDPEKARRPEARQLAQAMADLRQRNYRYLVVTEPLYQDATRTRVRRYLDGILGAPDSYPDGIRVYELNPTPAPAENIPPPDGEGSASAQK